MEWIEVADTAIKIGLGALITGLVTSHLADKKHKNDMDRKLLDDSVTLLKDITLKIEHAESSLNLSSHSYWEGSFEAKYLIEATQSAYEARGMAYLIGSKELANEINELAVALEKIYIEYTKKDDDEVENCIDSITKKKQSIYEKITASYNTIHNV